MNPSKIDNYSKQKLVKTAYGNGKKPNKLKM